MAATQCIYASRHGEHNFLKFKLSIGTGKKGNLNDFECGCLFQFPNSLGMKKNPRGSGNSVISF